MEERKKSPSWAVIIICFIVFWPIGFYLVYKKLATDKAAAMNNSKVLKRIGYFFIFCAVVLTISDIGNGKDIGSVMAGALFYIIGGILIMRGAKKLKVSGERYKKFIEIVINQQQYTIENIASQMGLSYEETVKGLQEMIDKDYFTGAYIDLGNHEIVFPARNRQAEFIDGQDFYTDGLVEPARQKVVKCPHCGGNNVIQVGQVCECDFCGSPIE